MRGLGVSCADGCRAPQDGHTPLIKAAMEGEREVVGNLLGKGANIEAKDEVRRSMARLMIDWSRLEGERRGDDVDG